MKPYDTTKYLRQMFHRPVIIPFAGVLMVIILMLIELPGPGMEGCTICYPPHNIPGTLFYDIEPLTAYPIIRVYGDGRLCFQEHFLTNLSNLPTMIMEYLEWGLLKENKIYLEIDKTVEFGRVQEVLQCIKKAKIDEVAIITLKYAAMVDFFNTVKR